MHSASRSFDRQIFVFQFPGVVQRMICGVPDQVAERPGAGHFTLGMQRPNCVAVGVAMRVQSLFS